MDGEEHQSGGGFIALIIVAALIFGAYHFFFKQTWKIVYIDTDGNAQITNKFGSKEACLDELHTGSYGASGECGSNCKYSDSGVDIYHCKNTED